MQVGAPMTDARRKALRTAWDLPDAFDASRPQPDPQPEPDCDECAVRDALIKVMRKRGDHSATTDERVRMRRHQAEAHSD
jgi:hypothetical protein